MIGIGIYQWQPHWDWNKSYFPPALSFLSLKFRLTLTSACLFLFVMGQVHIGFTHTNKSRCRCVYTRPESSLICILQRYIHMSSTKKKKTSIPRKQTIHILLFSFLFSSEHFFFFRTKNTHIDGCIVVIHIHAHTHSYTEVCPRMRHSPKRKSETANGKYTRSHIQRERQRDIWSWCVRVVVIFICVSQIHRHGRHAYRRTHINGMIECRFAV